MNQKEELINNLFGKSRTSVETCNPSSDTEPEIDLDEDLKELIKMDETNDEIDMIYYYSEIGGSD